MFVEPLEAGSKVCAAAYWAERDTLPRFENLDVVDGPIEVENVHAFGSLTLEGCPLAQESEFRIG